MSEPRPIITDADIDAAMTRASKIRPRPATAEPAPKPDAPRERSERAGEPKAETPRERAGDAILTCMADVEARPVSWLWRFRIPLGRITLIAGLPGDGKSFASLDFAARVSTGATWPDGTPCPRGSVLIIAAEDDPHDVIRPRLDAMTADCSRIHLLRGVRMFDDDGKPIEQWFTLESLHAMEDAIRRCDDCKLVIVDPIGSFTGGRADTHRDNETRAILAPVAKLAERLGPAVVMIAHTRKASGNRADDLVLGSRAFTGIARSVWHVSADPDTKGRRLFLPGKQNLSEVSGGLAYSITGDPARVVWERDPVAMNADEAMAARQGGGDDGAMADAKEWLRDVLSAGPVASADLKERAKADGIAWRTVERAKEAIGAVATREGYASDGRWVWVLPQTPPTTPPNSAKGETLAVYDGVGGLWRSDAVSGVVHGGETNGAPIDRQDSELAVNEADDGWEYGG